MRKLATGLLSMQSSNVPGSENVEVSEFKEEDAESANKSGFNTMEVDGFENLDHSGEAVLASNKFFNYRIGYEMKKELIKLNHALNGIGYKDLVKMAQELEISNYQEAEDAVGIHLRNVLNKDYSTGPGGDLADLPSASVQKLVSSAKKQFSSKSFNPTNFAKEIINEAKSKNIHGLYGVIDKIIEGLEYISILQERFSNTTNTINTEYGIPPMLAAAPVETGPASTQTKPVSKPVATLMNQIYVGKTYKDPTGSDPYTYIVSKQNQVTVSRDEKKKTLTPSTYGNWNEFARILNGKIKNLQVTEITITTPTPAPTPAPTTPAPAPTTPAPATPAAATGGLVSETVNGKPAVSIGTFGKDQIFLTIESVNLGEPQFYIKDGASGNAAPLGKEDGRVRSKLGPLEVARLADRLIGAGVSPERAEAFKRFMNLDRRQNRLPFGRKRREERLNEAQGDMSKASARQNRLDKLEKKGVI